MKLSFLVAHTDSTSLDILVFLSLVFKSSFSFYYYITSSQVLYSWLCCLNTLNYIIGNHLRSYSIFRTASLSFKCTKWSLPHTSFLASAVAILCFVTKNRAASNYLSWKANYRAGKQCSSLLSKWQNKESANALGHTWSCGSLKSIKCHLFNHLWLFASWINYYLSK